jgi:hypothetical protein
MSELQITQCLGLFPEKGCAVSLKTMINSKSFTNPGPLPSSPVLQSPEREQSLSYFCPDSIQLRKGQIGEDNAMDL